MQIENEFRLSSEHTYANFADIVKRGAVEDLARFVGLRLRERYARPVADAKIDVFARAALACLLMEAIEGWRQGWPENRGHEREVFQKFFMRELQVPASVADDFYEGVRCGILHQGESTARWMIVTHGDAITPRVSKIPPTMNLDALAPKLETAIANLETWIRSLTWDEEFPLWARVRTTLRCIE